MRVNGKGWFGGERERDLWEDEGIYLCMYRIVYSAYGYERERERGRESWLVAGLLV